MQLGSPRGATGGYLRSRPVSAATINIAGVGSKTRKAGMAYTLFRQGATRHAAIPKLAPMKGTHEYERFCRSADTCPAI